MKARFTTATPIDLIGVASERDEATRLELCPTAKPPQQLIATHPEQAKVEDHDLWPELERGSLRSHRIVRHARVMPLRRENLGDQHRRVDVIIDDQHTPSFARGIDP